MEELATPQEIADYLKVQPQTLRMWASKHKGPPFVMIEGARRYDWSDVREWVEARKVRH